MKKIVAMVALSIFVASTPFAAAKKKPSKADKRATWEARFKRADTDHSGGLSKAELDKAGKKRFTLIKENFAAMDTNGDGEVSIAERDAFVRAAGAK